jgi:hypothetical protein
MSPRIIPYCTWAPRILAILFAGFLALFALDAYIEGVTLLQMLSAFAVHLVPSAIVLALLAIAWHRESLGGVLYIMPGAALYIRITHAPIIVAPAFALGVLFILSGSFKRWLPTARI